MKDKLKDIKKIMKDGDTEKVVFGLIDIIQDMDERLKSLTKKCEMMESEIDGMSEEIGLLSEGMHIEDYDPIVEAVCPYCHEEIEINLENLENEEEFTCPHCKKEITLEWDGECDCGHDHHDGCDCDDCNCDDDK